MRARLLLLLLLPCCALGCPVGGDNPEDGKRNSKDGLINKVVDRVDSITPTAAARNRTAGLAFGETVNLVIDLNGKRIGTGTRITEESTHRGIKALKITRTREMSNYIRGERVEMNDLWRLITDMDTGHALYANRHTEREGKSSSESVTITRGRAIFEIKSASGTRQEKTVPVPNNILFSIDPHWLIKQGLSVGKTYSAQVLDRGQRKVRTETATIRDNRDEKVKGITLKVWEAEIRAVGGMPTTIVFTETGEMVKQMSETPEGTFVVRVVGSHEAKLNAAKMEYSTTVPVNEALPAWDNFNVLIYEAVPPQAWKKDLKSSSYVKVVASPERMELQLLKNSPRIVPATLPMKVPSSIKEHYLLSVNENVIEPDARSIRKMAQRIIGEEKRAIEVVRLLAGWIYQNIELRSMAMQDSSPERVLEARKGNEFEQANLFASLARSVGIPTRHCVGLLIQKQNAILHPWLEVWINNTWVPVDPSVNRVGLPAGYILLSRGKGDGMPDLSFQWAIRKGGIGLKFVSAMKIVRINRQSKSFTMIANNNETRKAMTPDRKWLGNLYWGFSVVRPNSWNGDVTPATTTLTSPDGQASVKIEALDRQWVVDRNQLQNTVATLKAGLQGFELLDSSVVPFGSRRQSRSLFIEFRCTQNGLRRQCQMYIIPKRDRTYRVSAWAPANEFAKWQRSFKDILATVDL